MRFIFFSLQTIALLSWLNYKYDVSLKDILNNAIERKLNNVSFVSNKLLAPKPIYTNYHAFDIIGQKIIILETIPIEEKLTVWLSSPLYTEMLSHSPKIERMKYFFNDRVEDNSEFKADFISYLEEIHMQYISGELSSTQFKNALFFPKLKK